MSLDSNRKPLSLTSKIFIALLLGAVTGSVLHYLVPAGPLRDDLLIDGVFVLAGNGFMRLLQMLVAPLVFFALASGILSMGEGSSLSKIGIKTIVLFIVTTAAAIALALGLALLIRPGDGMGLVISGGGDVDIAEPPGLVNTILDMIPTNPFESLATGNMLQIIVFSLIVGAICARLPEKLSGLSRLLVEGNTLMMTMTSWVMKLAPIGVFALIARTFSDMGLETFLPMISYMGTVFGALILAVLLIYLPLLLFVSRVNPLLFFRKFMPAAAFAFSSASSGATIPLTLSSMDRMGIPRRISSFTIPLGATINMHGTAIMQGVASVFIALAYGISLSPADYVTIIVTATLASFSTGAVPGVGLVTLAMVLRSVNLPLEGIAVIMGIDRILDMARTVLNVGGDAVVTTIVARQDGSLDDAVYNSRKPAAQPVET